MTPELAAAAPAALPRSTALARHAGWALAFLAVAGALQLLTPVPFDADTAYHVAVSRLIAQHGVLHAFPWTPFSWLADHYADKELLLHLLLVPLAGLSWSAAAKVVGAALGAVALFALYRILDAEGVPRAGVWALVPLAASGGFVLRFALVRPHLLSVTLALVVTWAAGRRRLVPLAVACALYPWCYVAWHVPLFLVAIAELARVAAGQRAQARPVGVAAAALAAGLAVHPNFPEIVRFAWIVTYEILLKTAWGHAGVSLGGEFDPYGPGDAVRFLLLPLAAAAIALVLAWRRRREDPLPLGAALTALAYAALALRTSRFVEYLAPFSVLALALALRPPLRVPRLVPVAALGGAFAFTAAFGAAPVLALARRGEDLPPQLGAVFRSAIPEGAQVFTCDWGLTGELLLELPERKLMVALDPTLFLLRDPERFAVWTELPQRPPPDAAERIRSTFGARYVLCARTPASARLFPVLARDPSVRQVLETPLWLYADLGAPAAPPESSPPR